MSKQVQMRVSEDDYRKFKAMAQAAGMTLQEYMHVLCDDEWNGFQRKDVQYFVLKDRIRKQRIEEGHD